jgi:hypothetical protein
MAPLAAGVKPWGAVPFETLKVSVNSAHPVSAAPAAAGVTLDGADLDSSPAGVLATAVSVTGVPPPPAVAAAGGNGALKRHVTLPDGGTVAGLHVTGTVWGGSPMRTFTEASLAEKLLLLVTTTSPVSVTPVPPAGAPLALGLPLLRVTVIVKVAGVACPRATLLGDTLVTSAQVN